MPIFRNHEARQFEQMAGEVDPYRNMSAGLEVDQRLQAYDLELSEANRQVLISNDRYQASSAYLGLARNRAVLMDTVYDQMVSPANTEDLKGKHFDLDAAKVFLVQGYQAAQSGLESADRIAASPGYVMGRDDVHGIAVFEDSLQWPAKDMISRRFLHAAVEGMDSVYGYVFSQFSGVTASNLLPNDFRLRLQQRVQSLLGEVENHRRAIERVTGGLVQSISSESVMDDVYDNAIKAVRRLDEITVWLTVPKLFDASFTLRNPLDETRPGEKKFDPSSLGTPVVGRTVSHERARPVEPARRFDAGALTLSAQPASTARPQRHFKPEHLSDHLEGEKDAQQTGSRHFDPQSLQGKDKPLNKG